MNGFLLIDKEQGLNSFKLVVILRKLAGQKRVGYAGTLDPLASGLMVLALGEYTKLLPYLEAKDKVYRVGVKLGVISNTYDAEGQVEVYPEARQPSLEEIKEILADNFTGEIKQIPPKFSAIQIDGKRAYDLAREGHQFELKERPVQIFYAKVLDYQYPELKLEVHCSSGTYIRSLAHDLGEKLSCGAMVADLRRTKIGGLSIEQALPLDKIKEAPLINFFTPPSLIFKDVFSAKQIIALGKEQYEVLAHGNFIENESVLGVGGVGLAFYKGEVVGVVETTERGSKLKFKKKLHIF